MNRIRKHRAQTEAIVIALILGVAIPVHAQEAVTLQWKFAVGDRFSQTLVQDSTMVSKVDVREVTQSSRMELVLDWEVREVDPKGNAVIEQRISRIVATVTMPAAKGNVTSRFDSGDEKVSKESRLMADSLRPLVNQAVTITMTPQGEITSVELPDETEKAFREIPVSSEGVEAFSVDALNELFQACGMELPANPVAAGEAWVVKHPFAIASGQQFVRESTCTLGEGGRIDVVSTLTVVAPETPVEGEANQSQENQGHAQFEPWVISEQSSTGTIEFDLEKGHARSSSQESRLVTLTQYHGMRCTTTVTTTSRSTLERK